MNENFHETGLQIHGNFSPSSNHLHPLQVENCDSNSRLVVDGDDDGKFRLERVKWVNLCLSTYYEVESTDIVCTVKYGSNTTAGITTHIDMSSSQTQENV